MNEWLDFGVQLVLAVRLLGPLLIFRWPLVGAILSEFVFDASDVIIWDAFGSLSHINYTVWDKSLDMYQLTIQAVVVWRWTQQKPRRVALWLYGVRTAGFLFYELTHIRVVFLVCANVFVLFFITYLIFAKFGKAQWFDQGRFLARVVMLLWLVKLPQEYVLHYMEVPMWNVIKKIFGI